MKDAKRDGKPLEGRPDHVRRTIAQHRHRHGGGQGALDRRFVCAAKSGGKPPTIPSSQYKLFTTTLSQRVCKDALDITGSRGHDPRGPGRSAAARPLRGRLPRHHERDGGRRIVGDPEEHHRPAPPRAAEELLDRRKTPGVERQRTRRIQMDLDLSEEQQMIVDMTRGMLEEHSTTEIVRSMEDDPKGYPDELWKQMGELGLNGLLIPESLRRRRPDAARGGARLRGDRPRDGAGAALRELRDQRGRAARGGRRRAEARVAAEDRQRRRHPDARLARARARLRRGRACSSRPRSTATTTSSRRREALGALRQLGRRAWSCSPAARRASTSISSIRVPRA